jgi:hypothetical protein
MRVNFRQITGFTVIALAMAVFSTAINAQIRAYRVTDRQVQTLLNRIENRADVFKNRLDRSLDRSNIDGTRQEDSINYMVAQFEAATNRLKSNFEARRSTAADVQEVLSRAAVINRFMLNNRLQRAAEQSWNLLRTDLNTLAGYYNVRFDWNAVYTAPGQPVYRVADRDVQSIIQRLENNTDRFKNQMGRGLDRSSIDGTRQEDSINNMVAAFESATNRLRDNFNSRRSTAADAQEVFNRGALIDRFMRNNRLPNQAENTWTQIRGDLNTLAGYYNVAANWDYVGTPTGPVYAGGYTVTDAQMRNLLTRIRTNASDFRSRYERWNTPWRRNQAGTADLSQHLVDFDRHLNDLTINFRQASISDVEEVLRAAAIIDSQITTNRPNYDLFNRWGTVRNDLSTLASNYRMSWDWNNPVYTGGGQWAGGNLDSRLTGTFRLNRSLSDNAMTVIDRSIINARYNTRREMLRRNLERRLTSPENLAIEVRGNTATIATIAGQTVDFTVDGRAQTETAPNGRQMTARAFMEGGTLKVNYEGYRQNDYFLTFDPLPNGQLRATRRVYIEDQDESVTVVSVYDRISSRADFNFGGMPNMVGGNTGGFIIPNNTVIVATLDTPLSTRTARDGDRFTMTVDAPSQYNGAVIEGRVIGERSGVVSGRANMNLSFETIRLRNGQTYQFAGLVSQVRETDGDLISVNNEGAIRDQSQTTRTVTRAGIGAVLGAIIGAIAGGGEGAAIGAGVGAGAGAGTVILQGRDNLELDRGTQFTITATAPTNVGMLR